MSSDGEQFSAIAKRYCELVDGRAAHSVDAFLDSAAECLIEVAREAHRLRPVECDAHHDLDDGVSHEAWNALFMGLGEYLGNRSHYWQVFDPTNQADHESVGGSLADDLADIYRDLRRGLVLWESERRSCAVWEWRFGFWSHWGAHLFGALSAAYWWRRADRGNDDLAG